LLGIVLHDLFWYSFYEVSSLMTWVANLASYPEFFLIFFNFIFQYFIDLELGFIIYFALTFMRFFWSYNPSWLDGLTQVGPSCFSCPFFKLVFLFQFHWINCKLCFIIYFVCFVRGYLRLITQVAGLIS
jgi:hypothetical protein